MSNNIEGKVVVITGASSGLGEATARLLSRQGARVVLGARRADRLKSLADNSSSFLPAARPRRHTTFNKASIYGRFVADFLAKLAATHWGHRATAKITMALVRTHRCSQDSALVLKLYC